MHKIFLKIHEFLKQQKPIGLLVLLLFVVFTGFFASKITLEEDITRLVPKGNDQNMVRRVLAKTDLTDKIIVTISAESGEIHPDELTRYAGRMVDSLEKNFGNYVSDIQGKVPEEDVLEVYDFVYNHLPVFLNSEDYNKIQARIAPDSIETRVRSSYKNLISPTGLVTKEFIFKDPLSITNLGLEKLRELQVGEDFDLHNDFLITRDKNHVLLFLTPVHSASETAENTRFAEKLDHLLGALNQEFEGVEGNYFGGFLYSIANAEQIKKDIQLTISIAAGILLVLLIFFYRRLLVPFLLFLPSVLGGLLALSLLYFIRDTVSAISLGIGAILLGISLDYSLHILTHFRNNNNISQLYGDVTRPVLMSSLTTAIAFLCLLFVRSEALRDLGIFAAISVVSASVFALVLIPLLYRVPANAKKQNPTFLDKFAAIRFYRFKALVIFLLVLLVGGLFFFTGVEFDKDLSKLNYEPSDIKTLEERTLDIAGRSEKSLFLVSWGNDIDEALFRNNRLYNRLQAFKDEGEIESFSSIGGVVLSTATQTERIEAWKEFWTPEIKDRLESRLIESSGKYGFRPESFQFFYHQLDRDFEELFLEDYQNTSGLYLQDFISTSPGFATVTSTVNLKESETDDFVEKFSPEDGVVAIDRRQVNEAFLGNLKNDFNRLIAFSLGAVFLVLLLFYQNLELTLLTLLPIAVTWIIALGVLAVLGIEFNVLNIIISTFIFGLGLDYSIFITNACIKEYEAGKPALPTYQTSILLSVITTLLGIGALIFARHPALRSVSLVSGIGVVTAVSVAFILQTWLFEMLFLRRKRQALPPFSFSSFLKRDKTNEKLYRRQAVLDNYRYKTDFKSSRNFFNREKERLIKVANFIEPKDQVVVINSGLGELPVFLSFKHPGAGITGFESQEHELQVARNTFRNQHKNLWFTSDFSKAVSEKNVFLLLHSPDGEFEEELKKAISRNADKVILFNNQYPHRWILDLNFEIIYRQNQLLFLRKID